MRSSMMAAALVLTAALASAQQGQSSTSAGPTDQPGVTSQSQTQGTSPQVAPPTSQEPATTKSDAYDRNGNRGGINDRMTDRTVTSARHDRTNDRRGTGVATGFIAAGIGLALLGLFARRRNVPPRRYDDVDDDRDDLNPPAGGVGPRI